MKTFQEFLEAKKIEKSKDDPCWKGYAQLGTKKNKKGKEVPNCVPVKEATDLEEEAPVNAVASGNVDMTPHKKRDKRRKSDTEQMYRRNLGLNKIKSLVGR